MLGQDVFGPPLPEVGICFAEKDFFIMRPWSVRIARNVVHPMSCIKWSRSQKSHPHHCDFVLVTVPGSGTHWLRTLLASALIRAYGLDDQIRSIRQDGLMPTFGVKDDRFKYKGLNIPRIQHSHSQYFFLYKGRNVIFLTRDLRDIMVSQYRRLCSDRGYQGTFGDMLRGIGVNKNRRNTLESRIDIINTWISARRKLSSFHIVRYEDLSMNTMIVLRDLLDFMDFPRLSEQATHDVVEDGSLDNMRRLERENPLPQYGKNPKIGLGIQGGYRDYFTESDRAWFLDVVSRRMPDWLGYDYNVW